MICRDLSHTIVGMTETHFGASPLQWRWIAAGWLGVGLIDASQTVFPMRAQGMHHAWVRLFVTLLLSWLPWALATPVVIGLGRRYPISRGNTVQALGLHAGALGAIGLITAAWTAMLESLLNPWAQATPPEPFTNVWLPKFYFGLLMTVIVYAFILAITSVFDSRERMYRQQSETTRLNDQLSQAKLHALLRQMEPHFMFNTLNAICGLVRDNRGEAAVSMIVRLSDFLRRATVDLGIKVALEDEVEYLQRYLGIQKLRFEERLTVVVDIPAELLSVQVPSLLLQPLVENAINHGISKRAQGGTIRISGSSSHGALNLRVHNDGPCLQANWNTTGSGIGLSNLRNRLHILYGTAFQLILRNHEAGGVESLVSLPLREM